MELIDIIRKMVDIKGVTAYEIAKNTSVSERAVGMILNGEVKRPHKSTLDSILKYLESDKREEADEIVSKKLKTNVKEVGFDEFMEAEYLPIKVQAGYLIGLEEKHPIELKKMLVPKEFEKGFYKVIEIEGDSMNDGTPRSICDGDKLLLKEVDGGNYLEKKLPYRNNLFVIVSKEGIVCKQIIAQDIEKRCIVCHSFNTLHSDYEIPFDDIYQLFYVKKLVERKIRF